MSSVPFQKTWKLTDGAGLYALVTHNTGTTTFTVVPTDVSYVPINVTELNNNYFTLYAEAVQLVMVELGRDTATIIAVTEQIAWLFDATSIDVIHSGGTWSLTPDMTEFKVAQSALLSYLNEIISEI